MANCNIAHARNVAVLDAVLKAQGRAIETWPHTDAREAPPPPQCKARQWCHLGESRNIFGGCNNFPEELLHFVRKFSLFWEKMEVHSGGGFIFGGGGLIFWGL